MKAVKPGYSQKMSASILVAALLHLFPYYLDPVTAQANVDAALMASEATGVDPVLLLGMAYVESRFNPYSLSRIQCKGKRCKRVTGAWLGDDPPPGARPTWYCGVLQTGGAVPWEECLRLRDLDAAYLSGAQHLVEWQGMSPCAKQRKEVRLDCALRGYNGGWWSIRHRAAVYVRLVRRANFWIGHTARRLQAS